MDTPAVTGHKARFGAAHLAWLAMYLSILIWSSGEVRPGMLGNTGNWYRIALVLAAGAAGTFALISNASRLSQAFSGPIVLLLCYGLFAMVSSLYIPEHSFYSMWKGLEVVIDVLAMAAIMACPRPLDAVRLAYRIMLILFTITMATFWMEALLVPSSAFVPSRGMLPYSLQGVLPVTNGNGVGFIGAVVAFAGWCHMLRSRSVSRKILSLLLLVCGAITLIVAQSRTSLVGLAIALAVQVLFDRRFGLFVAIVVIATIIGSFTAFSEVAGQYVVRGQSKELLTSLSGRTQGWEAAWAYFQQSPVIGHGFAAAARTDILGTTGASTLHGAFFDVVVGVGLLGLVPWLASVVWTGFRLLGVVLGEHPTSPLRRSELGISTEMLGLLALILVRSTTSSGLAFHEHSFMLFLLVVGFASTKLRARQRTISVGAVAHAPTSVSSA